MGNQHGSRGIRFSLFLIPIKHLPLESVIYR